MPSDTKEKGLELRKDYGVLTYNDTEMKHIVEGGVSTVIPSSNGSPV